MRQTLIIHLHFLVRLKLYQEMPVKSKRFISILNHVCIIFNLRRKSRELLITGPDRKNKMNKIFYVYPLESWENIHISGVPP